MKKIFLLIITLGIILFLWFVPVINYNYGPNMCQIPPCDDEIGKVTLKDYLLKKYTTYKEVLNYKKEQKRYIGYYENSKNPDVSITFLKEDTYGKKKIIFKNIKGEVKEGVWGTFAYDKFNIHLDLFNNGSDYISAGFVDFIILENYSKIIVKRSDFPDEISVGSEFIKVR